MVQEDFFRRFVSIFHEVASTSLEDIDNLVHVPDPTVAPAPLLPWLGGWVGTPAIDSSLPEQVQRDLVRTGSTALAWRGTRRGLVPFLELVAGAPIELRETGGMWREGEAPRVPPKVAIRMPSAGWLSDQDLLALVREEVPVNVELELWVGERELTARPEPEPDPEPALELDPLRPGSSVFRDPADLPPDDAPIGDAPPWLRTWEGEP
jgi:phage tail-like protein